MRRLKASKRMLVPVLTATLTTLSAFIPLVLIGGPMGDVVLTLPVVMACVLIASLIECFLVLPAHLRGSFETMAKLGRVRARWKPAERARDWLETRFLHFRDVYFMGLVRRALDNPGATLCAAVGGIVCALSLVDFAACRHQFRHRFRHRVARSRHRVQRRGNRRRQGRVHRRTRTHASPRPTKRAAR